jgi:predicted ester cyclase
MIIQDTETLVRTVYSLFNSRQTDVDWLDKITTLASGNSQILNVPLGQIFQGREGLKQYVQGWNTAFPDSSVEITNVVATSDQAAVEFVGRGTHNGVLRSPGGDIQPTERKIELRFCDVYRIHNGQITSLHSYFDLKGLLEQLGNPQASSSQAGSSQE